MKWRLFHILSCCSLLLAAWAGLASCSDDSASLNEGSAVNGQECILTLNVNLLESRAGTGSNGTAAWERMHSLRVVIVSEATGTVEVNNLYEMAGESLYGPIWVTVKPDGTKSIYLIANEEWAGELANATGSTLSDYLESVTVGSNASDFRNGITNAVFTVKPYGEECCIPMSAVYQIETSAADAGTQKDCGTFHIVRTMTKYSFSFINDRVSGLPVYVKSWEISNLTMDKAYLMPHFSPEGNCWGYLWNNTVNAWGNLGAGWTEAGAGWKDWLAKVSDESNIDPDDPSADENGWLTCYEIPTDAQKGSLTHVYEGDGLEIPIDGKEHEGEIVKYLPEGKNLKVADYAFTGEQEYQVNVTVAENGEVHEFDPVTLPNLRALFRNTHVRVIVKFGQTMKDDVIYAKIIDWRMGRRVEGELRPENE